MFFRKNELADIDLIHCDVLFCPSIGVHTMSYYFLMDELLYLIAMCPLLPNCNLTHKYYSKKLLPYVHQSHLKDVWQKFINYPKEQQLLEQAAIIVAQWYQAQKRIFHLDVEASLDKIAQQVLEDLKNTNRNHPIFSTSAKQFSFWKYNNINDNQWSRKDEKQIIDVLQMVLFDKLGFRGPPIPNSNILNPTAEHILIDCVLETKVGNAISLAIIFQSVARRLGVRCDLVCFPTHFFLSWTPKCDIENPEEEKYFYIDILHGGLLRSKNDCPRTRGRRCPIESFNIHNEISPTEMVLRMINCLQMVDPNNQHHQDRALQIRSLVEFRYMIEPHDIDAIGNLGRHYLHYHINISGLIITLQRLLDSYSDRTSVEARRAEMLLRTFELHMQDEAMRTYNIDRIVPKERSKKVKYAVGMIVNFYDRLIANHTGVIIWWDDEYNSKVRLSHEYITYSRPPFSGSSSLKQPFYTILSENGNTYYAAQDDLVESYPPKWIEHNEIGRYFCNFEGSYYVPNNILTKHFPYDMAILNALRLPT